MRDRQRGAKLQQELRETGMTARVCEKGGGKRVGREGIQGGLPRDVDIQWPDEPDTWGTLTGAQTGYSDRGP